MKINLGAGLIGNTMVGTHLIINYKEMKNLKLKVILTR